MAVGRVRWRNVREFLDDLPTTHCTVKPEHEYCTVCLRINHIVAHDCPLYHQKPKRKPKAPPVREDVRGEPIKDHVSADDVKDVLKGEDFPIIEFGGPRGMKADEKVLDVEPLEVTPLPTPPVKKGKKAPAKKEEPEGEEEPAETRSAAAPPGPDRDPEKIVQEIMEELEFPDEEDLDEGEEPEEEAPAKKEGPEGDRTGGEEPPEEPDLDADEGDLDGEAKKGPPPVVVEKEAVKRRRPKQR